MLHKFKNFIAQEKLFEANQKVLLAVSGGLDSVTMSYLFKAANIEFGIAHCNFKLRGQASDDDEVFVKNLAQELDVEFFCKSFETEKTAQQTKESIQVVARNLRYSWFNEILKSTDYQHVATAHHLNDSIETVLYNFTKGCGIRGLHGILSKKENIIRPLLFATREEIESYANSNEIIFREDASNTSDKYQRNKIRHHVIPILQSINPAFEKTASENIQRLKETEAIFEMAIDSIRKTTVSEEGDMTYVNFQSLPEKGRATILYELIKDFGFNNDQCRQILEDNHVQSGSSFYSNTHRLIIDRSKFIINKSKSKDIAEYQIKKNDSAFIVKDKIFIFSKLNIEDVELSNDKNIAHLDFEKLERPLKLRRKKTGDIFQPFGMGGKSQKVKKFFTDQKLSIPEKENVWILESAGKICWIVGHRIDERFKLTDQTQKCFQIKVKTR